MLLAIEICLTAIAIALAHIAPELGANWFEKWERRLGNLARRRALAVFSVGILALALRAALLPILPIPEPAIHDEFSHLLLADTLAHGRMANPTHPMWIHFETFHVNQKPTYASMYYPGQGMISGGWPGFRRASLLGRMAEYWADVRRDLLDAAGLVAAGLGTAGRLPGGDAAWPFQLLGQYLFRRSGRRHRRRAGIGSLPRIKRTSACAMPCSWDGSCPAG